MKHYSGCDRTLDFAQFHRNSHKPDGYRHKCGQCRNTLRRENRKHNRAKFLAYEHTPQFKEKQFEQKLKREYGITVQCYNDMAIAQDYKCAICNNTEKSTKKQKLSVDHDHNTGKVRGLLCHNCNVSLGLVKDDLQILSNMIRYLGGI